MKTSNKILIYGLATMFFISLAMSLIVKANMVTWSAEECDGLAMTTKNIDQQFAKLKIEDSINATLKQGPFNIKLEAPEKTMELISYKVHNGELQLKLKPGKFSKCPVNAIITCPKVDKVTVANGARLNTDGAFETEKILLEVMNGSRANINLNCDYLESSLYNSASVELTGNVRQLRSNISNSGDMNAENAQIDNAEFDLTNSAYAKVKADSIPFAKISNSATLEYVGQTVLGNINTSNSGNIRGVDK